MTRFKPVPRSSVVHHIMQQMKDAMASGALRRGDRLPPEPELADQLQVSRASLREVLKVLESLGILETRRGSGTFVAKEPKRQMVDSLLFLLLLEDGSEEQLIELRYVLESTFTRLAQQRLTPRDIDDLERSIAELERATAAGSVDVELDIGFHRRVLEATGNPFVVQVGTSIYELFRESMGRGVRSSPNTAIAHHRGILEALVSGDGDRVDDAIRVSYVFWKGLVRDGGSVVGVGSVAADADAAAEADAAAVDAAASSSSSRGRRRSDTKVTAGRR